MTTRWAHRIKIRHLFTEQEDWDSVQSSMNAIADELEKSHLFRRFDIELFRNIPKGDDVFGPVDYADKLLEKMYDYADHHRIWIEL